MLKAVIFDLDDTLIDTSDHIVDALKFVYYKNKKYIKGSLNEFLSINNMEFTELLTDKNIRVNQIGYLIWFRMFEILDINPCPLLVDRFFNDFQSYILKHISLKPGFRDILSFLKSKKIKIAILSNGSFDEKIKKVSAVKIKSKIDVLVTSELTKYDKPENDSLVFLLKKINLNKDEIVYVGDSYEEDISLMLKFGIKTIYLKTAHNLKNKKTSPLLIRANNSFEVTEILKKLII